MKQILVIVALVVSVGVKGQWSELGGTNSLGVTGTIYSVCKDGSGNIYAAGAFTNSAGSYYVAIWDGTSWTELGGLNGLGANNEIWSICSDTAGNIYAAGQFTKGGSYYVAKWDGTYWSELGGANSLGAK